MITRTIKYTASDGTEHDSPQEAAQRNLTHQIKAIGVEAVGCTFSEQLARNPEALRDALEAYFDDLKAHPDVDDPTSLEGGCDGDHKAPACLDPHCWHKTPAELAHNLLLTQKARRFTPYTQNDYVEDWFAAGWTRQQLLDEGMAVEVGDITSVSIAQDGEWQHFDLSEDGTFTTDLAGAFTIPEVRFGKVDPCILDERHHVDHPQHCRPFGTKED